VLLCVAGLHGQASGEDDRSETEVGETVDGDTDSKQTTTAGLWLESTRHLTDPHASLILNRSRFWLLWVHGRGQ